MNRYRVRLSPRAEEDFLTIVAWIGERSASGVEAWIDAYKRAEQTIGALPFACGRAYEAEQLGRDLRETTFASRGGSRYRLVFMILGDQSIIVRIRGAGQPDLRSEDL